MSLKIHSMQEFGGEEQKVLAIASSGLPSCMLIMIMKFLPIPG